VLNKSNNFFWFRDFLI